MMGVTGRQKDVLDFVTSYIDNNGKSPSLTDIMEGAGIRTKARVHAILTALKDRGRITWLPHRARTLSVVVDRTYELPPAVHDKLQRFCAAHGELPVDVLTDAVTLHIDACGG